MTINDNEQTNYYNDLENYLDGLDEKELLFNKVYLNNFKKEDNLCCICLEFNNSQSRILNCGCSNRFHQECIKQLKKKKINNCPLCRKEIKSYKTVNYKNLCYSFIILSIIIFLITPWILIFLTTTIVNPMIFILFPSELKYCDNYYLKCEYLPIKGILINNTINAINTFDIISKIKKENYNTNYEIVSLYKYIEHENNKSETCINFSTNKFKNYKVAIDYYKNSIGKEINIYISKTNKKYCKLNYKFYNKKKFTLNMISLSSQINLLVLLLMIFIFDKNINVYNKFTLFILPIPIITYILIQVIYLFVLKELL
jgi:hypothetical protein